jgi:hypothetical protein
LLLSACFLPELRYLTAASIGTGKVYSTVKLYHVDRYCAHALLNYGVVACFSSRFHFLIVLLLFLSIARL